MILQTDILEQILDAIEVGGISTAGINPDLIPDTFVDELEAAIGTLKAGGSVKNIGEGDTTSKKSKKINKDLNKLLGGFGKIAAAAGPIGLIVAALEGLGFLQPVLGVVNAFMGVLSTALVPVLTIVLKTLTDLLPPFQLLINALAPVITMIIGAFAPALDLLAPLLTAVIDSVLPMIDVLLPLIEISLNLGMAFSPLIPVLNTLIPLFELAASVMTFLLEPITLLLSPLTIASQKIGELNSSIGTLVSDGVGGFVEGVRGALGRLEEIGTNVIGEFTDNIKEGMENAFDEAIDKVKGLGTSLFDTIKGWFT